MAIVQENGYIAGFADAVEEKSKANGGKLGPLLVRADLWVKRYNDLRNRAKEAWSDIDVQLKRRYNLIPNLVETVKGYATHERELFEKVTKARVFAMQAQTVEEKGKAETNTVKKGWKIECSG